MSDRRIVVFGFDEDESKMEFHWTDVEPHIDMTFALNQAFCKCPLKYKDAVQASDLVGTWSKEIRPYFMVYHSKGEIYAEYISEYYDEIFSSVVAEGGGWIVNFNTQETEWVHIPKWENRATAQNTKEAMEFITTFLSQRFGGLDELKLLEVERYAEEFGIPFSADFMQNFMQSFSIHQPQWNSSSAYC